MCVIVHQPAGVHINKETAQKLWKGNPHGGGFAFIDDDGSLVVEKSMQFKDFWSKFETARSRYGKRDFLLHMRIATHGKINLDNVHPFVLNDKTVMAHNGIIHGVTDHLPVDDSVSDTRYFADHLVPQLPETWLDSPFMVTLVEDWIGWSKLMFLNTNPTLKQDVYRLGEWEEYEGLYLSKIDDLVEQKPKKARKVQGGWSTEDSRDWDDWDRYQRARAAKETMPEWEFDYVLEALEIERESMYINHGVVVLDEEIGLVECTGCLEAVNLDTGDCECWDKVCSFCWNFVANDKQENEKCLEGAFYDYEDLTPEQKNRVLSKDILGASRNQGNLIEVAF